MNLKSLKIKLTKDEKAILKRYDINIDELLEESYTMEGYYSLTEYMANIEDCFEFARTLWPLKHIQDELIIILECFKKIQNRLPKIIIKKPLNKSCSCKHACGIEG